VSQASDVDELFKLPPGEFTAARNALVAKLKKSGHDDESTRVKVAAQTTGLGVGRQSALLAASQGVRSPARRGREIPQGPGSATRG
jgi:hypothetical protein